MFDGGRHFTKAAAERHAAWLNAQNVQGQHRRSSGWKRIDFVVRRDGRWRPWRVKPREL